MARIALFCVLGLASQLLPFVSASQNDIQGELVAEPMEKRELTADAFGNADLAPAPVYSGSNTTVNNLGARSPLEFRGMEKRACKAGYFECTVTDGCCPTGSACCSYDYCMDPDKVCCPSGTCETGWHCCGKTGCYPQGGDCCSDDGYCEPGNMCIRHYPAGSSTYIIVCCTDVQCTAVVTGGTTSYLSTTTTRRATTTLDIPTITEPANSATAGVLKTYTTIYYWYYYAYYWTVINVRSTVTYSTVYETTTITVKATDSFDASSAFEISASEISLSFTPPADANTDLATLAPSNYPTLSAAGTAASTTAGRSVNTGAASTTATTTSTTGQNAASTIGGPVGKFGVLALFVALTVPGVLMILL